MGPIELSTVIFDNSDRLLYTRVKVGKIKNNPTMKDTIINSFIAGLIIAGMLGVVVWSAGHDKQVEVSVEKYEECVRTEMHTTVMAYYDQHGEYPVCTK